MADETRVPITSAADIVTARQKGRALAQELGFVGGDVTLITAAISEVSRNIVEHAMRGEITFQPVHQAREIIDQAISQAREALVGDPANSYLSGHLVEARRRKLDLLRRATALATETD